MEKVIIVYKTEVENYLNELILKLFQEKYFSYLENSILYKDKIIDFIESDIAIFHQKKFLVTQLRLIVFKPHSSSKNIINKDFHRHFIYS